MQLELFQAETAANEGAAASASYTGPKVSVDVGAVGAVPVEVAPSGHLDDQSSDRDAQLDLFGERSRRLAYARIAIAEGRLAAARQSLAELSRNHALDEAVSREAERIAELEPRLSAIERLAAEVRPRRLVDLARQLADQPEPWASLRSRLLRIAAEEARSQGGDGCELDGQPPGYYLLEAGALSDARRSLEHALSFRRSARWIFLLADVRILSGDAAAARRLYVEALLLDPFDPALDQVRDPEVAALADIARYEL